MKVLIVDDEAPARRKLRRLLEPEEGVEIQGEAADGEEAVVAILEQRPDLVLLDIQMPRLGGFGVVERVGVEEMPLVIFVTAFDEHALRAFELHAFDYLTKPFAPARLHSTLGRARRRLEERRGEAEAEALRRLLATLATSPRSETPRYLQRLRARRSPHREVLVPVDDIVVLRARRNDVEIVTPAGTYRRRATLAGLEARLDPEQFVRINRSEIIRLDAIHELQPWFRGDYRVLLEGGETLSWSRRYRPRDVGEPD